MSELQLMPAELEVYDQEQMETELAIRNFCINGLAEAVPQFMDRERAADLLSQWFPGDQLAVASLYRHISENRPTPAA